MSDTLASIQHKRRGAKDLHSVVHAMKALAAASISQYERSVSALADYARTIDLGLSVCLRETPPMERGILADHDRIGAIIFGSDQGLVGQFNERLADYALKTLSTLSGVPQLWAVGERIYLRLQEDAPVTRGYFPVPGSVGGITPLVGQLLEEAIWQDMPLKEVYLFYNRPLAQVMYSPVSHRLLPLDNTWQRKMRDIPWQTEQLPEVVGNIANTLKALIREYLFVSLFRACAESLTSENASRLAAMQRAENNIDELLEDLNGRYHRLRQSTIDEELFDVISGFEALMKKTGV